MKSKKFLSLPVLTTATLSLQNVYKEIVKP